MKKILFTLCLALVYSVTLHAQNQLEHFLKEGVAYHDQGLYDQAIASYQKMLELDPNSSLGHYEISLSYMYNKAYDLAIEHSEKVIEAGGRLLIPAIVVKASSWSDQGKVQDAIDLLEETTEKYELDVMVLYNLAICHFKRNDLENAERALVAGIYTDPFHPSSHYMLAVLKENQNLRTASMLSAYFFLLLEPNTARSEKMLAFLDRAFMKGVDASPEIGERKVINLTLNENDLDTQYGVVEMGLTMAAAVSLSEQDKKKKDVFCERTTSFLELLPAAKERGKKEGLSLDTHFYLPFYSALSSANYKELFCKYTNQRASDTNQKWLTKNEKKVKAFKAWTEEKIVELIQLEE
ncbi:tetratricopeptide repeat protein [Myroides sp. DW712]|uniref:tetratricopeptide repeat protein n=1 Tax=Myroides sp. DW712 TaxID=3389800 RepID=UPI00397876B0